MRFVDIPTQGEVMSVRFSQLRRPATLLPYRGVLRVGAGNRAGTLESGDSAFSSGAILAFPGVRASFVLRDPDHSKGLVGNGLVALEGQPS
ncbi:conserved hypothetical protein [uncultured Mycobacterium sp.]|uniref:Uncharacterized protein n=1 Tax=uncultured Mycobacterium sp. TaxID=171292 RepID=A0A1Y5P7Y9_9MYCO|nr:conserved hypothetical protein [uncultured Mycobacterium sp.]